MVKTERCAFSEYHVFPGHGMKYVRKDGQPLIFGSSKAKSLYLQRLKPSKLMWTQVHAGAHLLGAPELLLSNPSDCAMAHWC